MSTIKSPLVCTSAVICTAIAAVAYGLTYRTIEVECPIDGTEFSHLEAASGYIQARRLDFRKLGAVADPPPLPVCPTDSFIAVEFTEAEIERLRPFIVSKAYQDLAAENSPYFLLATIQTHLGRDPGVVGYSYLRAAWEAEDNFPELFSRYAQLTINALSSAADTSSALDLNSVASELVCIDLERRLGKFTLAERRLSNIGKEALDLSEHFPKIVEYQLQLISARDTAPHEMPSEPSND